MATPNPKGIELLKTSSKIITPFQRRVYEALCEVPKGEVTTYQLLGRNLQCRSAQAIGQALKRNPHSPTVPCHRVVASNLTLGGFHGQRSGVYIDKKLRLLKAEGVRFADDKVHRNCVYTFGIKLK